MATRPEGTEHDARPARGTRRRLKSRMKELLLLLPNLVRLVVSLLRDPRVARADKLILAGAILYVIAPLDFLPDMVPFLGQIDDTYLVAVAVLRMLNRADGKIVADHWRGEMDIKQLVSSVIDVATHFLPTRIRAALTAKVEIPEKRQLRRVK